MKITKIGHCCLVIETKGKRILTDPGSYTIGAHPTLSGIDYVFITHEHQDHFHLESLKVILENNPSAVVYANDSVGALLDAESISHTKVNDGDRLDVGGVAVAGVGEKHAQMHSSIPQSANLGFMFDGRLWYPGDAFTDPGMETEILALPVSGPWMKLGEAIDYAIMLKPKHCFPVHDGTRFGSAHVIPERVLVPMGIGFKALAENESLEF